MGDTESERPLGLRLGMSVVRQMCKAGALHGKEVKQRRTLKRESGPCADASGVSQKLMKDAHCE